MLLLIGIFGAITGANAETIAVPNTDLYLNLPELEEGEPQVWAWSTGDITSEVKLGMRNVEAFTDIRLRVTGHQPAPHMVADDLLAWIHAQDEADTYQNYTIGEMVLSEHETLGQLVTIPFEVFDTHMEQTFFDEMVLFAGYGTGIIVTSISSDSQERSHEVLTEVLAMMEHGTDPVATEELPTGEITTQFGLELALPAGWRALTDEELSHRNTELVRAEGDFFGLPANLYVIDEHRLVNTVFECNASDGSSLYIVDPDKSETALNNFTTWAEIAFSGGMYQVTTDSNHTGGEVIPDNPMVIEELGEVEFLEFEDREGYLVRAKGMVWGEEKEGSLFYTAWDNLGITCLAFTSPEDNAVLETFERTMRTMQVTDSINHPMPMSTATRYARWWPYSHPLLQLYWLPIPMLLLSGFFVYKSD